MTTARAWAVQVAREIASEEVTQNLLPLAEFQQHAALRLTRMIREWGGALLADGVGLGKTRVALTVATTIARDERVTGALRAVWCCVPARLVQTWRDAVAEAGLDRVVIVTHASLSRGKVPGEPPAMIIVDEAHRFRNLATRRRQTLIDHADVPLLLLTATPIANAVDDLWNLLELFLDGEDVRRTVGWDLRTAKELAAKGLWDPVELVREVTVRRTAPPDESGFGRRPTASLEIVAYDPSDEEAWIWANLEAEARALRIFDAADDWPTGLFVEHVLRRWESGPAALLETVVDIEAYARRRLDAHQGGRALDRASFRTLFGNDPDQEVFAFVYPASAEEANIDAGALRRDLDRLSDLRERVEAVCERGLGRDDVVLELAADSKLLVFTSYQRAARGLFSKLVRTLGPTARVGLITGSHARATGIGRASPTEVLRRFAPRAHGLELREHETLDILVATDCIAEGVNLQDCGRIVLADLPYTPLGVEQRVGRLLRPGGPHERVTVFLPRPRNWNDSLGMRRRLRAKVGIAEDAGFRSGGTTAAGPGPFEALTAIERIAAMDGESIQPGRAMRAAEHPNVWLVLATVGRRPWLFTVGEPRDLSATLTDLAWDETPIVPCDVPAVVTHTLSEREAFLRAALAAPAPLALDSPEALAWRRLLDDAGELGLDTVELAEVRGRLLRRQRLGVRRRLAQLTAARSSALLLRYIQALPGADTPMDVRLVRCLGLAAKQTGPRVV